VTDRDWGNETEFGYDELPLSQDNTNRPHSAKISVAFHIGSERKPGGRSAGMARQLAAR
jgi:hypothetical protein